MAEDEARSACRFLPLHHSLLDPLTFLIVTTRATNRAYSPLKPSHNHRRPQSEARKRLRYQRTSPQPQTLETITTATRFNQA